MLIREPNKNNVDLDYEIDLLSGMKVVDMSNISDTKDTKAYLEDNLTRYYLKDTNIKLMRYDKLYSIYVPEELALLDWDQMLEINNDRGFHNAKIQQLIGVKTSGEYTIKYIVLQVLMRRGLDDFIKDFNNKMSPLLGLILKNK